MKIKAGLEGAVKFNQNIINLQARMPDITELNAWRDILYGAELIGQNIVDGKEVGYGNVSQLLRPYNAGNNNKRKLANIAGYSKRIILLFWVTILEQTALIFKKELLMLLLNQ